MNLGARLQLARVERDRLRRAALAGDRAARRQLEELGEPLPPPAPPRPWCDTGERDGEDE